MVELPSETETIAATMRLTMLRRNSLPLRSMTTMSPRLVSVIESIVFSELFPSALQNLLKSCFPTNSCAARSIDSRSIPFS